MLSKNTNDRYGYFLLILSLIGMGDTTYLLAKSAQGVQGVCLFTEGCDTVLGSSYATFLGQPTALWGLLFYSLVFMAVLIFLVKRSTVILYIITGLSSVGFIASLGFFYIQAFVLNAFCEFCLLSGVTSALLFITSLLSIWVTIKENNESEELVNDNNIDTA